MGLSGLSRKPGFTSSKLLPVTENTEGITEHIPAAANPAGKPKARWPGRLEKQLPQRVSTRLLLLVSPERLFSRSWQKSQPGCHFTQSYPSPGSSVSRPLWTHDVIPVRSLQGWLTWKRGGLTPILNNGEDEWREHKRFGEGWRKKQLLSPSALFDTLAPSHCEGREKPMKVVPSYKRNLSN